VLHDFIGGPNDGATSDHGYVVQAGNVLYGMKTDGGLSSNGVIFSLTTDGTTFQVAAQIRIDSPRRKKSVRIASPSRESALLNHRQRWRLLHGDGVRNQY
jgi:hypothetical protein